MKALREANDARAEWANTCAALRSRANKAEDDAKWYRELALRAGQTIEATEAERDELRAKLDAAENRPTLDRKAVESAIEGAWEMNGRGDLDAFNEAAAVDAIMALAPAKGWPEWLGPKVNPDDIEVTKTDSGYWAEGLGVATHDMTPDELRVSNKVNDSISSCARREAVARFIEREEAETDDETQRVEKQAIAFYYAPKEVDSRLPWNSLDEHQREQYRAAIRAGWTPPESEDEK